MQKIAKTDVTDKDQVNTAIPSRCPPPIIPETGKIDHPVRSPRKATLAIYATGVIIIITYMLSYIYFCGRLVATHRRCSFVRVATEDIELTKKIYRFQDK